jgi:general secretion pathway protein N
MSRSKLIPSLLLGLLFLLILLASAPARLLLAILPAEQLILQGLSGSLWEGTASRVLVKSGSGWLHLGASSWSLSPLSLVVLAPRVEISSHWGRQTLNAVATLHSRNDIEFSDVYLLLDAALLQHFLPVGLVGDIAMQFKEITIRNQYPESATGRIVWQNGGWMSPQGSRQLGSYAVDVQPLASGGLAGEVISLAGDLQANGPIILDQENYSVDVQLSGSGLDDPQLRQALQLLAIPEGDTYRVRLKGSL